MERGMNRATGTHQERRRSAPRDLDRVAITTQNQIAAAMSSAARTSSSHPPRFARSLLAVKSYASASRCTMVRQPVCRVLGRIHRDNVMAAVRSSDADAGTLTTASPPSKLDASPYRPRVHLARMITRDCHGRRNP
jgi:hypothetical protein